MSEELDIDRRTIRSENNIEMTEEVISDDTHSTSVYEVRNHNHLRFMSPTKTLADEEFDSLFAEHEDS